MEYSNWLGVLVNGVCMEYAAQVALGHPRLRRHAAHLARDVVAVLCGMRPGCMVDYTVISVDQAAEMTLAASQAAQAPGALPALPSAACRSEWRRCGGSLSATILARCVQVAPSIHHPASAIMKTDWIT